MLTLTSSGALQKTNWGGGGRGVGETEWITCGVFFLRVMVPCLVQNEVKLRWDSYLFMVCSVCRRTERPQQVHP